MSLFNKSLIVMFSIAVIAVGSLSVWNFLNKGGNQTEAGAESAENWSKRVIETEAVTTNLYEGGWIRAQFAIEADTSETKQALENATFQTQSIILKILSQVNREQLAGKEGLKYLESEIKDQLNNFLKQERVLNVYTTDRLIQ